MKGRTSTSLTVFAHFLDESKDWRKRARAVRQPLAQFLSSFFLYLWANGRMRATLSFSFFLSFSGIPDHCSFYICRDSTEKEIKEKEDGNVNPAAAECWSWNDCPMDTAVYVPIQSLGLIS